MVHQRSCCRAVSQARASFPLLVLILFCLSGGAVVQGQHPRVEPIEPFSQVGSPALLQLVNGPGWRLTARGGEELLRIWVRNQPAPLEDGVFLGVVSVMNGVEDARNRAVPTGTYSLRYVKIPPSSEHRSCMSQPNFLVLMPLVTDTEAPERLSYGELVVSDRRHPLIIQVVESRRGETPGAESLSPGQLLLHFPWGGNQSRESITLLLHY